MNTLLATAKRAWSATARVAAASVHAIAAIAVQPRRPRVAVAIAESEAYDSLLVKALGDKSQVERLIHYELRRCPDLCRDEAIERANERWNRDLRR